MTIAEFELLISFLVTKLSEILSAPPIIYFVGLSLAVCVIHIVLCIINYYVPKNGGRTK